LYASFLQKENQKYLIRTRTFRTVTPQKMVKPVNFDCIVPEAQAVSLIGDFNDWHPNAHSMKCRTAHGSFRCSCITGIITSILC